MKKIILALGLLALTAVPLTSVANEDACSIAQEIIIQSAKKAGVLEFQIEHLIIIEFNQTKSSLEKDLARIETKILLLRKDTAYYCGE